MGQIVGDDDYTHDLIDLPLTPAQIEVKRLEKEMAEQQKAKELEMKQLKEMTKQKSKTKHEDSDDEETEAFARDKNQMNPIEEEEIDLENYLYRVYFKDDELNRVKEAQEREVFDDLFSLKQEAVNDT